MTKEEEQKRDVRIALTAMSNGFSTFGVESWIVADAMLCIATALFMSSKRDDLTKEEFLKEISEGWDRHVAAMEAKNAEAS